MSDKKKENYDKKEMNKQIKLFFEEEWNEWEGNYINFVGDYYIVITKAKPPIWTLLDPSSQDIYFFYLVDRSANNEEIHAVEIDGAEYRFVNRVVYFRVFQNPLDLFKFGLTVLSEYFVEPEQLNEVINGLESITLS
ncbi:hypothetical protein [Heyndrickxia ginsengihumi]|uniref:hypothetical protein n=1 Tax=Heyndrickxia ginsengihumi TaxID=363870 RepID=UPI00203F921F|nr:hypothetical protein [Heyndrickxia ginsengihumi]MCM3024125.1 hypothetical protein [Heyndrickxia ginsengihumi]